MFGIEDKYVWLPYLLCIASTLLCVAYGLVMWNRGDEPVQDEDVRWATEERRAERDL